MASSNALTNGNEAVVGNESLSAERGERSERGERTERGPRRERGERGGRGRSERVERNERGDQAERSTPADDQSADSNVLNGATRTGQAIVDLSHASTKPTPTANAPSATSSNTRSEHKPVEQVSAPAQQATQTMSAPLSPPNVSVASPAPQAAAPIPEFKPYVLSADTGLNMVETRASNNQPNQAVEGHAESGNTTAPRRQRPPRAANVNEPLQMVETSTQQPQP